MIGVVRVKGAQHTDVINDSAHPRQQFAHRHPTLSLRSKLERRRQDSRRLALGAQLDFPRAVTRVLGKSWLGVKEVSLVGTAIHEKLYDPLGPRFPVRLCARDGHQQVGQSNRSQATPRGL